MIWQEFELIMVFKGEAWRDFVDHVTVNYRINSNQIEHIVKVKLFESFIIYRYF